MAHIDLTPKFGKDVFNIEFEKLITFFKAKLSKTIVEMYFERLMIYPLEALKEAINDHIKKNRPTAGGFPTVNDLANICSEWLSSRPVIKHKYMKYDQIEDVEYPLTFLILGFKIIDREGITAFRKFAKQERMPENDFKRVVDKWRYINDSDYKAWVKKQMKTAKNLLKKVGEFKKFDPEKRVTQLRKQAEGLRVTEEIPF